MVFGGLGWFRKVREVNWKNFLLFSTKSDWMVQSYDQKSSVGSRRGHPLPVLCHAEAEPGPQDASAFIALRFVPDVYGEGGGIDRGRV